MRVSEAILKYLKNNGVEYVFGVPAGNISPIYDSLNDLIFLINSVGIDRWALITPVFQGSYQAKHITEQDTLKFIRKIKNHIKNSNFIGILSFIILLVHHIHQW